MRITALWRAGGTGRRRRLKIVRPQGHGGSSPSPATTSIDCPSATLKHNLHSLLHSFTSNKCNCRADSRMQVYLGDSKSGEVHSSCGFDPHLGHHYFSFLVNHIQSRRLNCTRFCTNIGLVLSIYRRHRATCKFSDDRISKRCRCPLWATGSLDGKPYRSTLKTRSFERAQQTVAKIEEGKQPERLKAVTVTEALDAFLRDCEARVSAPRLCRNTNCSRVASKRIARNTGSRVFRISRRRTPDSSERAGRGVRARWQWK